MGADIYLNSVFKPNQSIYQAKFENACCKRGAATTLESKEKLQKQVEKYYELMYSKGYFRDSYNGTSLLSVIGLSWWQDVGKWLDDNNRLSIENAKILKAIIEKVPVKTLVTKELLLAKRCTVDDDDASEDSVEGWQVFFEKKQKRLIALLKLSIKLGEPLYCSI